MATAAFFRDLQSLRLKVSLFHPPSSLLIPILFEPSLLVSGMMSSCFIAKGPRTPQRRTNTTHVFFLSVGNFISSCSSRTCLTSAFVTRQAPAFLHTFNFIKLSFPACNLRMATNVSDHFERAGGSSDCFISFLLVPQLYFNALAPCFLAFTNTIQPHGKTLKCLQDFSSNFVKIIFLYLI